MIQRFLALFEVDKVRNAASDPKVLFGAQNLVGFSKQLPLIFCRNKKILFLSEISALSFLSVTQFHPLPLSQTHLSRRPLPPQLLRHIKLSTTDAFPSPSIHNSRMHPRKRTLAQSAICKTFGFQPDPMQRLNSG